MTALNAKEISVRFSGVRALTDVDLEVPEGQLVGLIGANGAGKTTFIDAITGFVRCRGKVELAHRDITNLPPHRRAALGLARTWQSIELFDDLSVGENLAVAAYRPGFLRTMRDLVWKPAGVPDAVYEALGRLGLESLVDALPSELAQGQRKLVGVARALAARPDIVCLDEPGAGLDTGESRALGERLRAVVDGGTAMLLIDHDMGLVLGVCDYVVVLEFGEVIARGKPEEIRSNPRVVESYLGGGAAEVLGGAS